MGAIQPSYAGEVGKPPIVPYPPELDERRPRELQSGAPEFGDFVDVAVEGANWANQRPARSVRLHRVELRQCRLTGSELHEAQLSDVSFIDCKLDLVGLRFAKLERVVFSDCRMEEIEFYEASLKDVLFEHCQLREATFTAASVQRTELRSCDITGLRGIEALRGARMPWNDILQNAPLFAAALGVEIIE